MKKAVIYWSGTGNTAAMASAIAAGMGEGTELYSVDQFTGCLLYTSRSDFTDCA